MHLFGRGVENRARSRRRYHGVTHDLGETKIGDAQPVAFIQHQVWRFEVTMHNSMLVGVCQPLDQLARQNQCSPDREAPSQPVIKGLNGQIGGDHKQGANPIGIFYTQDVRVIEPGAEANLSE